MSLHALELNPVIEAPWLAAVIEAPWLAAATLHPRTSVLEFAIVKELEKLLIFFHFVPDVQYSNYTEMFMYNALKNNEPLFCRDLNVSRTSHPIYENNEAALNSSGYSFQAYKITTSIKPTCQVLLMLGDALCDTLNGIRHNINTVHVEKDNLFWLTQSNCVWADIVGDNKAKEYLLEKLGKKLGDMSNTPHMYNQNKDLIHSHFHPNTLPSELNQILQVRTEASDTMFHTWHNTDHPTAISDQINLLPGDICPIISPRTPKRVP